MARLGADGETQGTKGLFPVGVSVAGLTQDDNLVCCSSPALDSLDQPHRQRAEPCPLAQLALALHHQAVCHRVWHPLGCCWELWCPNSQCEPQGSSTVGQESFPTLRSCIPSLLCSSSVFLFQLEPVVTLPLIPHWLCSPLKVFSFLSCLPKIAHASAGMFPSCHVGRSLPSLEISHLREEGVLPIGEQPLLAEISASAQGCEPRRILVANLFLRWRDVITLGQGLF